MSQRAFDWPALQAAWVPDDPLACAPWMEHYYRAKFDVAQTLAPASILEIGVRAGYSALAFLQAVPAAQYLGLDLDEGGWGGVAGYLTHARTRLEPYNAVVLHCDTQAVPLPPDLAQLVMGYELWHVDGDHSFRGAVTDLVTAHLHGARWILLDDYDFAPDVRRAAHYFLDHHRAHYEALVLSDGGYRGHLLLTRRPEGSPRP